MLTEEEKSLLDTLSRVSISFSKVIGDGASRQGDYAEAVHHIHALQNMVLSQVAARVYPENFRLMGEVFADRNCGEN